MKKKSETKIENKKTATEELRDEYRRLRDSGDLTDMTFDAACRERIKSTGLALEPESWCAAARWLLEQRKRTADMWRARYAVLRERRAEMLKGLCPLCGSALRSWDWDQAFDQDWDESDELLCTADDATRGDYQHGDAHCAGFDVCTSCETCFT